MSELTSPKIGAKLLEHFLRSEDLNQRLGDFEEVYISISSKSGVRAARLWYGRQILKSLPGLIFNSLIWSIVMFKNYLKISLRNLLRYRGYSFLNIAGLTVGMACFILLILWVNDEISYDRFHENFQNIYRIVVEKPSSNLLNISPRTPAPLASSLKEEFPEIVHATLYDEVRWRIQQGDDKNSVFREEGGVTDPEFFKIFSFEFVRGDPEKAFINPLSVVLTEELAAKYFGNDDPVGKTIIFDEKYSCTVTGVLRNIPENSHIRFSYLVPFEFLTHRGQDLDTWTVSHFYTYVLLREESNFQVVNRKVADILKRHSPNLENKLVFQPLKKIHLYSLDGGGLFIYVYIFFAVALFILIIACVNYMNLVTAQNNTRAGEIGLRKVVGAQRSDIIKQFFVESILTSSLAIICALIIVYLVLPVFNNLSGKQIFLLTSGNIGILSAITGFILFVSIVSGSYPSLFLSSFHPVKILKGTLTQGIKRVIFRKVLVTLQFILSISLMIGAAIVAAQIHFIKNKNLGYEKENLIHLEMNIDSIDQYETVKNELLNNPDIPKVTATNSRLIYLGMETTGIDWEGRNPDKKVNIQLRTVDHDYLETFQMEMAQGRFFSREYPSDAAGGYIINEAAVKAMGIETPVGKWFSYGDKRGTIIGIVKDFHFHSLHDSIEPLVFFIDPNWSWYLFARINSENIAGALETLENNWERINPGKPFEYSFLNETINSLYGTEQQMGKIINYFTIIAVFIAGLGLFGLASFMAEQRTKEVGIRKVLGASVAEIIGLLTKEFLKWVIVANIIAWPLAYVVMKNWLHNFAYRMDLNAHLWIFLLSGLSALIIALLTVSYQAIRAALTNPAEALRFE